MRLDYQDSGVDIELSDRFTEHIAGKVESTYGIHKDRIIQSVGGFASLFDMQNGKYLAAGTDGVGTKVKLAQKLNVHNTVGIDLVAMCANDILCTGARPLFFQDYIGTGKLHLEQAQAILEGVIEGCQRAHTALVGGETAEMPDVYPEGEYDLAGFCVGEVEVSNLVDGSKISTGQKLIGFPSSGFHSNGYSLLRKLFPEDDSRWVKDLLIPTRLYVELIQNILKVDSSLITGMAHITGGGFLNIARMNPSFSYKITNLPEVDSLPGIFGEAVKRSKLSTSELYKTFNMGVGFVIATNDHMRLSLILEKMGEKFYDLGEISTGSGVYLNGETLE